MSIEAMKQEPVAYLFTNVQSGDIEASTDPDHKEGEREMWYREPLVRPPAEQPEDEAVDCPRCGHCCPQRQPLTFSQLCEIDEALSDKYKQVNLLKFARAIEAAHGITGKKKGDTP